MSLIIALGSNLGNKLNNLNLATEELEKNFGKLIAKSHVFTSEPYGEIKQDDFLNMCLEFNLPKLSPQEVLETCLEIEQQLGRIRIQKWGPRIIDIDILFYGLEEINERDLIIPHPHINERSFVVLPLKELPYFKELKKSFNFSTSFTTTSYIYDKTC